MLLPERAFAGDRWKARIDDVLSDGGIADDVAFTFGRQAEGIDFAKNVAQVEIGGGDFLDILTAHVAAVSFVALGHRPTIARGDSNTVRRRDGGLRRWLSPPYAL